MFHKKLQSRGTGLNPRLFPRSGQAFSRFEIFNSLIFNTLEIEPLPIIYIHIYPHVPSQTKYGNVRIIQCIYLILIWFIAAHQTQPENREHSLEYHLFP